MLKVSIIGTSTLEHIKMVLIVVQSALILPIIQFGSYFKPNMFKDDVKSINSMTHASMNRDNRQLVYR